MPDFVKAEELIRQYLKCGTRFRMNNIEYIVKVSGKPKPQKGKGEPKTDIYVLAESETGEKEIKISYKKENADFLENKMGRERAEQIFGEHWQTIICENTRRISDSFEKAPLLFWDQKGRTEPGSMTLGWRFELFNKLQGGLSCKMENMTMDQVFEVYAGEKLEDRKKNAKVNGTVIPGSGTAEYILVADRVESTQEIINRMKLIKDYIIERPEIYFGCKALNYRSKKRKIEGDRSLSVQVDWKVQTDLLEVDIEYDKPLVRSGKEMKAIAEYCLKVMKKKDATEITESEINGIPIYKK